MKPTPEDLAANTTPVIQTEIDRAAEEFYASVEFDGAVDWRKHPAPDEDDSEPEDEAGCDQAATKRALTQWERKALNRLKRGQGAACQFADEALSETTRAAVERGLAACEGADDVRALFAALEWE